MFSFDIFCSTLPYFLSSRLVEALMHTCDLLRMTLNDETALKISLNSFIRSLILAIKNNLTLLEVPSTVLIDQY